MLLLSAAGCGLEKTEKKDENSSASTPTTGESGTGSAAEWDGTCTYVPTGESDGKKVDLPPSEPQLPDNVTATLDTTVGRVVLTLEPERAPCTVNSFVSLAEQGYYDQTVCHRVIDGFMAQCGNPDPNGDGGPGYSFDDELYGDEEYTPGAVAMANAGPATNGSQFFVVTGEATHLTTHTIFGHADPEGLANLQKASADGTEIKINTITVD